MGGFTKVENDFYILKVSKKNLWMGEEKYLLYILGASRLLST